MVANIFQIFDLKFFVIVQEMKSHGRYLISVFICDMHNTFFAFV